jgi:hypothetical protein
MTSHISLLLIGLIILSSIGLVMRSANRVRAMPSLSHLPVLSLFFIGFKSHIKKFGNVTHPSRPSIPHGLFSPFPFLPLLTVHIFRPYTSYQL